MKIFTTKSKKCLILFEKEIILIFSLKKKTFFLIFSEKEFSGSYEKHFQA